MLKISLIAIGGSIGALLRYFTTKSIYYHFNQNIILGTLTVNLIGCLLIGLLWGLFTKISITENIQDLLFIGIISSFTTFSTFALENLLLLKDGRYLLAISNIALNNIIGIFFVAIGFFSIRFILSHITLSH